MHNITQTIKEKKIKVWIFINKLLRDNCKQTEIWKNENEESNLLLNVFYHFKSNDFNMDE